MKIYAETDKGLVRDNNQDSYAAGELAGGAAFVVVCDGMGGAAAGALASSIAVKTIREKIASGYHAGMSDISVKSLLISALDNANKDIFELSLSNEEYEGMGTTVVAAVITDEFVYIVHAGDSRAYFADSGELTQLTRDHSVVQDMLENGEITAEEVYDHPKKHIITRALGVDSSVRADFCQESFDEEILLVCTDGLTNYLSDEEIGLILKGELDAKKVSSLINKANLSGGGDNITAVAVSK